MRWQQVLRPILDSAVREVVRRRRPTPARQPQAPQPHQPQPPSQPGTTGAGTAYPGDFVGDLEPVYDPHPDGRPDPGEVVWAWVPYEEDHSRGKDRPVLLVGRDEPWLLALQLTSRDHDRDHEQELRAGRLWVDIGAGGWDRRGRPSEARVNRILRIDPAAIRREGAVLARERFDEVAAALRGRGRR